MRCFNNCIISHELQLNNVHKSYPNLHHFLESLETKLGTTPVTSLSVILDSIVSAKTDPLGKRTVLSLSLRKGALGAESLLGRLLKSEEDECQYRCMHAMNELKYSLVKVEVCFVT